MVLFAAGLIASAFALGALAGPALGRARWPTWHPGIAVVCWSGVLTGTLASVYGVVLLALLTPPAPAHGLLEWLHRCLHEHGHRGLAPASALSLVIVVSWCARLASGLPRLLRAVGHRRRHRDVLRVVAREDERYPDVLVVDHPVPVAYCLPGRYRPIVVSTGARTRLDHAELAAVLAHERAHLRQRHHLLLLVLEAACALLPSLPTLRRARTAVPSLLEMAADDVAARRCGGPALSAALRRLAVASGPAGALAAGGTPADRRQALSRRLARLDSAATGSAAAGPSAATRLLALATAATMAATPLVTAALALTAMPLAC